jgi:hypothetical protein
VTIDFPLHPQRLPAVPFGRRRGSQKKAFSEAFLRSCRAKQPVWACDEQPPNRLDCPFF